MKDKKKILIIAAIVIIAAIFLFTNNGGSDPYEPAYPQSELNLIEDDPSAEVSSSDIVIADTDPEPAADPSAGTGQEIQQEPQDEPVQEPSQEVQEEPAQEIQEEPAQEPEEPPIDEDGWYDSKDEVALYIHTYGKLPGNYISKKEAEKLGWSGGGLDPYAKGKSIGGSHFGNYEGILPDGHNYTECDINTAGKKSRGAKRIVFSDDGLIYYTDDHYETFTLLYGSED